MNTETNVPGRRAKFGVVVPSTNTAVEHDFNMVAPRGVSFHVGRMHLARPDQSSDSLFTNVMEQMFESCDSAIERVMTCEPNHLIMGVSAVAFWGGKGGSEEFQRHAAEVSGVAVTTGTSAVKAALDVLGFKTIAFLSPYQNVGDDQVSRFFTESGYRVRRHIGLKAPTARVISDTSTKDVVTALRSLAGDDIDAIVQVGTNMAAIRLADEAERWLDTPVIAINAATLWFALRTVGINDQFDGYGMLLREF